MLNRSPATPFVANLNLADSRVWTLWKAIFALGPNLAGLPTRLIVLLFALVAGLEFDQVLVAQDRSQDAQQTAAPSIAPTSPTDAPDSAPPSNPETSKLTSEAEIAQLVGQLTASPSFEVRERAMYQLWERYAESRAHVERLTTDTDPEVARRGRWIMNRWEIGLLPDLPWDIRKKLAGAANDPAAAFVTLLDSERLREAGEVLRMTNNHSQSAHIQQQIKAIVVQRYTELVHTALRTNDLDSLLGLLEACADTTNLAIARAVLLHRSNRQLTDENILAASAADLPRAAQLEIAATCWAVVGEFDKAIALAKVLPDPTTLAQVLIAAERWEELAVLASECVEDTLPPDATITQYATWLIAARFAGDQSQVDKITQILMDDEGRAPLRWRALAAAGQMESAIEAAKSIEPMAAVDLLRSQKRFDEAFAMLAMDPAHPEPELNRLLAATAEYFSSIGVNEEPIRGDSFALEKLAMAIELLYEVGNHGPIEPVLLRLREIKDGRGEFRGLTHAVSLARKVNRGDLIPRFLANLGEPGKVELSKVPYLIINTYANSSLTLYQRLATAITKTRGELSALQQWETFFELISGNLPEGWSRKHDLDSLCEAMLEDSEGSQRRLLAGGALSYSVAEFFTGLGRPDLAQECYIRAIGPLQNPIAAMKFAKHQLASGNPETALILLDTVAKQAFQPIFSERYLMPDPSDAVMPTASSVLLARAIALRRLGRTEEADLLDQTLDLVPVQPYDDSGEDYLAHLAEFSEIERLKADAPYELRRCVLMGRGEEKHQHYFRFSAASMAIADSDPTAAHSWHSMGFATSLPQLSIYARYYAIVPANIYATAALAAAKKGDEAQTRKMLDLAFRQVPVDIALAEDVLPTIRKSGLEQVADEALKNIFDAGVKYLARYSGDASTLNNLAWVSAINGRNYEKSLELSQRAVFLEPDSVSYRDTLAEILFRLGRVEEAIALEKQCLLDQPGHWHLHEQMERFTNSE